MISSRYVNDGLPSLKLNNIQSEEISIIKDKVEQGIYIYKDASCPVCGEAHEFDCISEKDRYGFYYPLKICKTCGLVFANPRIREVDYDDFYAGGHQKRIYAGESQPSEQYFRKQYNKGLRIYNFLKKYIDDFSGMNILEVGCGAGGILKVFKQKGADVTGIDLTPGYIEYGKNIEELDLHVQNLFTIKDEKYDLIIYSHVLEHLDNPNTHLEYIRTLLKDDGMVYIEVPGIKSSHRVYGDFILYLQNAHIYNYSFTSLSNLLTKNGYSLMSKGNEYIRSLWKFNSTYSEKFLNDYENCLTLLTRNEKPLMRKVNKVKKKITGYLDVLSLALIRQRFK